MNLVAKIDGNKKSPNASVSSPNYNKFILILGFNPFILGKNNNKTTSS